MTFRSLGLVLAIAAQSMAEDVAIQRQRKRMVQRYVVSEGIQDQRVIEAMRATPRHEFVPVAERSKAYYDMALPIGYGQTISPPYIVAFMTAQLHPRPGDRVLEIGTGSGYQAAVLSPLVKDVYTIEIVPQLGRRAAKMLKRLGYDNVHPRIGDGYQGWEEHAPFDKIIVTCSPENIPEPLVEQLAEGGHLVIPVGERFRQSLFRFTKVNGKLQRKELQTTFFVPMTGAAEDRRQVKPDPSRPELVNGGFEHKIDEDNDQPQGWYYLRQAQLVTNMSAPEGKACLLFANQTPSRSAHALQAFGVDGRKVSRLQVGLWVRGKGIRSVGATDKTPRLLVEFYGADRGLVGRKELSRWSGSFSWRHREITWDVPSRARLAVIGIGLFGAVGEICFDDVRISGVAKP